MLSSIINAFINGLFLGSIYGIIGAGLALIWGVMGIANFAHGDYAIIGSFSGFFLYLLLGIGPLLSIPIVFLIIFGLGYVTFKGITSHVVGESFGLQVFTTFGLSFLLRYSAVLIFRPISRNLPSLIPWTNITFTVGGIIIRLSGFVAFIISLGSLLGLTLLLRRTRTGLGILATASDKEVAKLMGIDVDQIMALTWSLGVALAAIGGSLILINYTIYPTNGKLYGLIAFVIVILGGLGNPRGGFVGGLIVGIVQMMSVIWLPGALQFAVVYSVFIIVLIVKPSGLFETLGAAYEELER